MARSERTQKQMAFEGKTISSPLLRIERGRELWPQLGHLASFAPLLHGNILREGGLKKLVDWCVTLTHHLVHRNRERHEEPMTLTISVVGTH